MVKAFHKNNLPEYKRLCAFHQFVARGMRAYAYPILFSVSAAVLLIVGFIAGNTVLFAGAGVLFVSAAALPFITLAVQNAKIDKKVRMNADYLKTEQYFQFEEDRFRLKICQGSRSEEIEVPYSQVPRVHETKGYFYIYVGKSQVLILNKANITEGSADELASVFRALGKRFREKKKMRKIVAGSAETVRSDGENKYFTK